MEGPDDSPLMAPFCLKRSPLLFLLIWFIAFWWNCLHKALLTPRSSWIHIHVALVRALNARKQRCGGRMILGHSASFCPCPLSKCGNLRVLWNFPVNLSAQMSSSVLQSRCLTRLKVQYNCSLSLQTWIWEGSPSTSQCQWTWPACRFLLPIGGLFKYLLWRQTCKLLQGPPLYCYIILTAKVLTLNLRTLKCHEIWCFF